MNKFITSFFSIVFLLFLFFLPGCTQSGSFCGDGVCSYNEDCESDCGVSLESELNISDFRVSGTINENLINRGVSFLVENNSSVDVLIKKIIIDGVEVEYKIGDNRKGFSIVNPITNSYPVQELSNEFPDLIGVPTLSVGETRGIIINDGQLVGNAYSSKTNLENSEIGDIYSPEIIIEYESDGEILKTPSKNYSAVIEDMKGTSLYSYFDNFFPVVELNVAGGIWNEEYGIFAEKGVGFIFHNTSDCDIKVNTLRINDMKYVSILGNGDSGNDFTGARRLVKSNNNQYPSNDYIENNPSVNNPIIFKKNELSGLLVTSGESLMKLDNTPPGVLYKPDLEIFFECKGNFYNYNLSNNIKEVKTLPNSINTLYNYYE